MYSTLMKVGTALVYQRKIQNIKKSRDPPFFSIEKKIFFIILLFEDCFNQFEYNNNDIRKAGFLDLLKIKVFWNKKCKKAVSVYEDSKWILSCDLYCIVRLLMWLDFGNSIPSIKNVPSLHFYNDLSRKTTFEGLSWFIVKNLGVIIQSY